MKRDLIVEKSNLYTRNAILENSELVELVVEEHNIPQIDSIYIGKIKKILPNKFAFVDLGYEKNSFLCLTDKQEQSLYSNKNNKKVLNIKEGQNIIVQVKKDGTDLKGALVTTNLSITGKYLVLLLNNKSISVSSKIIDLDIKNNLKNFVQEILPKNYGVIIRTNAKDVDLNIIQKELDELIQKSKEIFESSKNLSSPVKIYSSISETEKIIRDYLNNYDNVYVDDKTEYENLKVNTNFKNLNFYESDLPIFENFYIESQIEKAFNNKIWLKSGGFIVIDEVEAMNIIDVNSGKNISKNYDEMIFKTNLQAVYEAFRQIRLRNLSGMIIIDFINMKNKEHIQNIYNTCLNLANVDRSRIIISSMNELGLLQMTRKKLRKSLKEVFTKSCPVCLGRGIVNNEDYVANIIKNKILSIFSSTNFNYIKISSNKRIIQAFQNIFNISEFQKLNNKKVETNIIQTIKFDYFELEKDYVN